MLDRREMQTDILSLMKSWISCSNIFKILVDMNYEPLLCACDFVVSQNYLWNVIFVVSQNYSWNFYL